MGYIKESKKIAIDGKNFSAVGTAGEMKKRNVYKAIAEVVDNDIRKLKVVDFYETSGEVEYGMAVVVECTFASGHKVNARVDGMKFMRWLKGVTVVNGVIEGDYVLLMSGVVYSLEVAGGKEHKRHIAAYEKQEELKELEKSFTYGVGDIVKINRNEAVYLGEFWYYKPNINGEKFVNQLRKYKLYIRLSAGRDVHEIGEIYVESGKTKYNQPTEVLGHVEVDMDRLLDNAQRHYERIYEEGVGYQDTRGYYRMKYAEKPKNDQAYVLLNAKQKKDEVIVPSKEQILNLAWYCGWDVKGNYERVATRMSTKPYYYKEIEK